MSGYTQTSFSNYQKSLVLGTYITLDGIYPSFSGGGGGQGDTLGFVYNFAGSFSPGTSLALDGQTLGIAQYQEPFALLGTNYGGDGTSTFAVPNLQGQAAIGAGTGEGLTIAVGESVGSATVTLTANEIPSGGTQPFDNMQPSLGLTPVICTGGAYPTSGGAAFIGQIAWFAGTGIPDGWAACDGSLLQISSNVNLFMILGTTFGGNGSTTFALPDLRGCIAVGASTTDPLGTQLGEASITLMRSNMPNNATPAVAGVDLPFTNQQPSLAVNYIIAIQGIFPDRGGTLGFQPADPIMGQVCAFAGNVAPNGWAFCDGSLLSISQNQGLFAILGTTYGGNGVSTFALPDLRGAAIIGPGTYNGQSYTVGQVVGADTTTLSAINLPTADQICFLAGTLIQTPKGLVEVERLSVDDFVTTFDGDVRPIVWIGAGKVLATRGRRGPSTPVIVRKGALGPNVPHTDLRVTKGHCLFVDDVLIPVEFLVNGRSIEWDDHAQEVTLFHIELATHDVLLANGAPMESYRDDGNRWMFRNENDGWDLPPQPACAPVLTGGPIVDAVWHRLRQRAAPRISVPVSDRPDLHLLVDGRRIDADECRAATYRFRLPDNPRVVEIASRSGVPAELGIGRDPRCLGVGIRRIVLRQGMRFASIEAADPALANGFHLYEPDLGLRWTDGLGAVPGSLLSRLPRADTLFVHLAATSRYPLLAGDDEAAA